MSRLNPRIDSPWDAATALALVVTVVAAGIGLVPSPRPADPAVAMRTSLRKTRADVARLGGAVAEGRKRATARTWALEPEALGVEVMETIRRVAERRGLQVAGFSVGRPIRSAGLRQVPFQVTLSGDFSSVLGTVAELERPGARLVVGSIKMAPHADDGPQGAPQAVGRVTAALTVTAFLAGEGT